MRTRAGLGLAAASALGLACQVQQQERPSVAPSTPERYACAIQRDDPCLAEELPRITEAHWSDTEIARFLSFAQFTTVAVDWKREGSVVRTECRLEGEYVEVEGEAGAGRFWATERSLLPPAEVPAGCVLATHVVSAFALKHAPRGERHFGFEAVLVPLPCPSVSSEQPAPGCIGRGLTGSERQAAAQRRADEYKSLSQDSHARRMRLAAEMLALAPDDGRLLSGVDWRLLRPPFNHTTSELMGLLSVNESLNTTRKTQKSNGFSRRDRPRFQTRSHESAPPFLTCFPRLFFPQPSSHCWRACSCGGVSQHHPEYR